MLPPSDQPPKEVTVFHRPHRLTRTVAGALAVSALAAPAASAFPGEQVQGVPHSQAGTSSRSPLPVDPNAQAPAPTVTRAIDDGFDTGSAAIGAGGAAAMLLLTAAGASAFSRRHHHVSTAVRS
jgi:hypothetical protein